MTTYYVGPGGSNALAGTSYANRWLTITKALGASGIASGDTLYLAPGTYREVVSVAMTSPTVATYVIGDTDGSHTSGVPGPVVWTGFVTSDTTTVSSTVVLTTNTRDFIKVSNIMFVASANMIVSIDNGSTNWEFVDCSFQQSASGSTNFRLFAVTTPTGGAPSNTNIERCTFVAGSSSAANMCVEIIPTRSTVDYDVGITFKNNLVVGGGAGAIRIASTGAGVGFGGGAVIDSCTFIGIGGVATQDANLSTSIPVIVRNCIFMCSGAAALNATTSGQIVESYNLISGSATARTNVTAGTGSASTYSIPLTLGMERLWGGAPRPFFTPMDGSPALSLVAGGSPPTTDILNRQRPSGGASANSAAGAYERHDIATKETGTTYSGSTAIRITGPGDQDFKIPVDAALTTISVQVYYDTNHATTNPPQAQLVANGEIGFAGETKTAAATTGSWLTLTFTGFTPSAKGVVTLRLKSRSAAGNGYAIFDAVSIT